MTSKQIIIKADVKTDREFKFRHPRVSEKESYYDLVNSVKINEAKCKIEIKHPRVRKSVGAVNITNIEFSNSDCDTDDEILLHIETNSDEQQNITIQLFNAEPTQIEEINDIFIINRIYESIKILPIPNSQRKLNRVKLFMTNLFRRAIIKRIPVDSTPFNPPNELLPEEEFQQLHEYYLHHGLISMKKLDIENVFTDDQHQGPSVLNESGRTNDQQQSSTSDLSVQSELIYNLQYNKSNKSEHSIPQSLEKHVIFTESSDNFQEHRFKIDKITSDFTLQNKSILSNIVNII